LATSSDCMRESTLFKDGNVALVYSYSHLFILLHHGYGPQYVGEKNCSQPTGWSHIGRKINLKSERVTDKYQDIRKMARSDGRLSGNGFLSPVGNCLNGGPVYRDGYKTVQD
jgi:hypothetical protein